MDTLKGAILTLVFCERDSKLHFYDSQSRPAFSLTYPAGMAVLYSGSAHSASVSVNPEGLLHGSTTAANTPRIMVRLTFPSGHGDNFRLPDSAEDGAAVVQGLVALIGQLGPRGVLSTHGNGLSSICDHDIKR
jgi:hypothetical protein